jgi:hypothetical protein
LNKQQVVTDVRLAAVLSYMGYAVTAKSDPLGTQYLVVDPGDLQDAIYSYEAGIQIADAKSLLEKYEQLRQAQSNAPAATMQRGLATELLPTKIETESGREWTTKDFGTANFLAYRGNELIRAYVEEGRTKFVFSYDDGLTEAVSLFNKKQWRVSPHDWTLAGFAIRNAMREAKQQR